MRLVRNINPKAMRPATHIAADGGGSLCGRLPAGKFAEVYSSADDEPGCSWCVKRAAVEQASEHVAKMVCAKCGEDWPCNEWASEQQEGRCRARTAKGKPCTRFALSGDMYCRAHLFAHDRH